MTEITQVEKIVAILTATKLAGAISTPGLTIQHVAESADRFISVGLAKMAPWNPTDFYQSMSRDLLRINDKFDRQNVNNVCIQVSRVLRNEKQCADFNDLTRIIDDSYDRISNTFETTLEQRTDDDLSDLLDVAENTAGTPKVGFEEFVPKVDVRFRKWGDYSLIRDIIRTEAFMPFLISGLSGTGKSINVSQACAEEGREFIRLQITPETDETDMLGGFQLIDGNTVFVKGPVIRAMERGAILCIDEIDRGSNRLMALQGVAEGNPVLLKKTGEIVHPAKGFNIIATANTKGQGDDTGKFAAATILDEAFLERFTMVLEQGWSPKDVEMRILAAHMVEFKAPKSREVLKQLISWADKTRKLYGSTMDEYISTRRLCHIIQIFSVVKDIKMAVRKGVARYDADTQKSLIESFEIL